MINRPRRLFLLLLLALPFAFTEKLVANPFSPVAATDTIGRIAVARIVDGDTVPFFSIRQVIIIPQRKFQSRRQRNQYYKMIRDLKITYPYAIQAKEILRKMDSVYAATESGTQRRKYSYQMEKELHKQFEAQIRNLTYSQGRMLIKLINRETGRTSYQIIKEFRGGASAGLWQGVARLFSSNLKSTFDPKEEDRILNELIILYENGQL